MFPQLGAPIGFILSAGVFLLLTHFLSDGPSDTRFLDWGWRVPFLASAVLVLIGLYVRLRIVETPAFQRALANKEQVRMPMAAVLRSHSRSLVLGIFATVAIFLVFYLMTVFTLSWGTSNGWTREEFLWLQMGAMVFFGIAIPVSAKLSDRHDPRSVLLWGTVAMVVFGFGFAPMLGANSWFSVLMCLSIGLVLMGLTYGSLGAALGSLFPTALRYTGVSLAFNFAGILGGSLTPYVAKALSDKYGLAAVGWYLSGAAVISLLALLLLPRAAMSARHNAAP
jgi:MFS family permease